MTTSPSVIAETVVAIAVQTGTPVFLYSEPGCGKSATVRAIAAQIEERLHTIMLAVREPTDQAGLPGIFEENGKKVVRIVPPGWARQLISDGRGLVFFDEVSNATPATMNSALRIVQEGVVGDGEELPRSTRFVLAGNTPETNAGANELTAGIANRCIHVRWPFDYARWREGMLSRWKTPPAVPILPPDWADLEQGMRELIVGFLDTSPDLAQKQPADLVEQGRAWPSGRTWEMTAKMLAAAAAVGHGVKTPVAKTIVAGLVGAAAETAWSSWVTNQDLPSIDVLFGNPNAPLPKRQDQLTSVMAGVTNHVLANAGDEQTYQNAWTLISRVFDIHPSIAINAARGIISAAAPSWSRKGTPFAHGLSVMKKHLGRAGVDFGRSTRA